MLAIKMEAWREVDQQLRSIARRRAGLDAEEARWLRRAEDLAIWVELGDASLDGLLREALRRCPRPSS